MKVIAVVTVGIVGIPHVMTVVAEETVSKDTGYAKNACSV